MDLSGKITLFVENKDTKNGTIKVYSTNVSHKGEDDAYINAKISVRFAGEKFPPEVLNKLEVGTCYQVELINAWLDCRAFTKADGKAGREIFVKIIDAKVLSTKKVEKKPEAKNDLPF